jgi:hypothetical protein
MLARRSQQVTKESWDGHWGTDARYYARRSDGACFAIDGAARIFDLADTSADVPHARPVESLPMIGGYTLSVLALPPRLGRRVMPSIDGPSLSHPAFAAPRLVACGVFRRR